MNIDKELDARGLNCPLPMMMGGGSADLRMHQNTLGVAFGWRF